MNQKIKVYYSKDELNFSDISVLEKSSFSCRIPTQGNQIAFYSLCLTPRFFYIAYSFNKSANHDAHLQAGQFKADLWKMDVLELFIASNNSESGYQELNFSPAGAYWQCCFSDYRQRIQASEKELCDTKVTLSEKDNKQQLVARIPRTELIALNNLNINTKLNCCAIFGSNPRTYYSCSKLDPNKVDFHIIADWPEIELVEI